jgi:glycosyltransferase involved in cell wall biosynthesis
MDPLVSVIIPTYNRASIIGATIENVFEQTYRNIELIVVDDGSKDDTLSRLSEYGNRIRLISQANAGPAVARNRGVEAARGEIIAFQDSDDLWRPTKIERQVALLQRFGESVPCCLCNVRMRVVEDREVTSFGVSLVEPEQEEGLWLNVPEILATRFLLFNQAAAIRRDAFERAGGFDVTLKYLEDYDLPLRLSLTGSWAVIREPLVIYGEDSPESFSKAALKDPIALKQCELRIIKHMLMLVEKDPNRLLLRKLLRRRLKVFERGMREASLRNKNSRASRIGADLLCHFNRLNESLFRRSPSFPRVITQSVNESVSQRSRRSILNGLSM